MKPTFEEIGTLLASRPMAQPAPGYWQEFLREFHQHRREKVVGASGFRTGMDSLSCWFAELGSSKWAYGAGLAYAVVTVGFFLMPREAVKENMPAAPMNYQVVPAPSSPSVQQSGPVQEKPVEPAAQVF